MNKLIKIADNHYIVVNDSEIKNDDYYIDDTLDVLQATSLKTDWQNSNKSGYIKCFKITHSTQPIEENKTGYGSTYYIFDKILQIRTSEVIRLIINLNNDYSNNKYSIADIQKVLDSFTDAAPFQYVKRNFISRLEENYAINLLEWDIEFIDGELKLL